MADSRAQPVPLGIIRIALLAGVLLFGGVIAYLHATGAAPLAVESALGRPLFTILFFGMCIAAAVAIMVLRGAAERAAGTPRRAGTVIAAWAVGEGVAILGGVHWLLTGTPTLYVVGLLLFLVGLFTVAASD